MGALSEHTGTKPFDLLPAVGLAAAIALAGYPSAMAAWNSQCAHAQFSEATSVYSDANDPERLAVLAQAQAYNSRMAGQEADADILPYAAQLEYKSRPEIAWVEVPDVGIEEPVYRGCGPAELMAGAGHLEESALPVGGDSTRCVIAGHSGMSEKTVFDNLTLVEPGDTFVVWTLGEPYAYRVCDIRSVSPVEVEDVAPEPGRDLCTLITCTSSDDFEGPARVLNAFTTRKNDLRLLVTGQRCAYEPPPQEGALPARRAGQWTAIAWCALLAGIVIAALCLAAHIRTRNRHAAMPAQSLRADNEPKPHRSKGAL